MLLWPLKSETLLQIPAKWIKWENHIL